MLVAIVYTKCALIKGQELKFETFTHETFIIVGHDSAYKQSCVIVSGTLNRNSLVFSKLYKERLVLILATEC